jgi:hypothetical protein
MYEVRQQPGVDDDAIQRGSEICGVPGSGSVEAKDGQWAGPPYAIALHKRARRRHHTAKELQLLLLT